MRWWDPPPSRPLHSATLVAAGAILMIRVSPLLPQEVLLVVGLVGGLTLIVAGLIAVSQRDLKRLLAASTSSQYGFMLLAVGAGSPVAALVHLVAHAAMSSLFLGSGVFQHARAPRSSLSWKESAAPAGGPSSASPSRDSRSPASRPSPGSSRRTLSSRPPSSLRTPPSSPRSPSPGRY